MSAPPDPVALAQALIRCASVTPRDADAQDVLASCLTACGFAVTRLPFGNVANLFARIGTGGPHLCFAGHTDVVPPGDEAAWSAGPFAGTLRDGSLWGRGACDMKGAIAAFVAAAARHLAAGPPRGSLSLLITGDEEGEAIDGTAKVLAWMAGEGQLPDFCVVGEPTNPERIGEVVKIGRRGSLSAKITVRGRQGHVAYPARADNPVHRLLAALTDMLAEPLDGGSEWFAPSSLQVTSVDVGNPTANIIPAEARAALNIRFNDRHSAASLEAWLRTTLAKHAPDARLAAATSGEAFLTQPGPQVASLLAAVESVTGIAPRLDTGGGTSDARFIARYCPVAEFGLVGATMHGIDERVPVADLLALTDIYRVLIGGFLP
ncbi:MAG: succinyl-diaminopimelate desuccinylase [Acetobacteraceae bacterium]|nr:succinyl-diaminopimelate desuccinylase [Acetobacteraceae bacterium]